MPFIKIKKKQVLIVFAFIRRKVFWIIDALKGGQIRKNYKEIKYMMSNNLLNKEQLKNILEHAVNTTSFYLNYDASNIKLFPVITKNDIKNKWDDLYSKEYKGKSVHYMSTSGSTGTPFTMEWDVGKRKRQLAELIYFNEIIGQKLGQKNVYFRVWTEKNKKSKFEQFKQNMIPINILHLDDEVLEKIRNRLKKRPSINMCLGYASTYECLVKYLMLKGDSPKVFKVKTFVSGSEVLSMPTKQLIKQIVGVKVIDRYSNEENGFLAQSEDISEIFNVNTSGFFIEVLKQDSDESVQIGEVGRIVVTDLYSKAIPLIRYDTGDLAIKEEEKDGWTTKLKTIQGRKVDVIYDTQGKRLTSHTWGVYMWKFEKLKQYQFIQKTSKQYILKVNGAKGNYTDNEFIYHLKSILGQDAEIVVEHVEGIPTLRSGKFKKTVCEYVYDKKDYI